VLAAISVHFHYPGSEAFPVLEGIDVTVRPGEWVAVMGASGSGKSTLLKVLAGILPPSAGRVEIDETDLRELDSKSEIARRVGIVFQDPETQLVSATVERELAFGMEQLCVPPDDMRNRIKQLAQQFDITSVMRRPPQGLSGGEKQRVTVASILAMEPQFLLLDEPTALLDARARGVLMAILERLRSAGSVSVVLATASPEEALLADRVVVLFQGKRVADECPKSLFSRAEDCRRWGVARPPPALLVEELKHRGMEVSPDVTTADEFVSEWMRLAACDEKGEDRPS